MNNLKLHTYPPLTGGKHFCRPGEWRVEYQHLDGQGKFVRNYFYATSEVQAINISDLLAELHTVRELRAFWAGRGCNG